MEGSSVANIAGRLSGSVLVLGASPPLGYENSFTGNEFYSERGKTAPCDWPWLHCILFSSTDRPLWARHSRSCLTRVCERIVIVVSQPFLRQDNHSIMIDRTTMFWRSIRPVLSLPCAYQTDTQSWLGHVMKQLGFQFCRTAKLLAGYFEIAIILVYPAPPLAESSVALPMIHCPASCTPPCSFLLFCR